MKKYIRLTGCLLFILSFFGLLYGQMKPNSAKTVYPRKITVAEGFQSTLDEVSRIKLPQKFNKSKKYPLVVFLPWTGAAAVELYNLYSARLGETQPFVSMITPEPASTKDHSSQGFEASVFRYENRILTDLEALKKRQIVDPQKIVLVGYSMGGDISWAISQRYPEIFRGAIISGSRTSWAEKNGIARINEYGLKYFFVMGENETAPRLSGLNNTLKLLDKNGVEYQYERTEGGHVPPTFELFASGLKFILE